MLLSLHIENIAIIEKSDIEFNSGFNVLTGETGAGKSIIIDSINLLLGNKSTKNLIRTGEDYAFVSAVFSNFTKFQLKVLDNNDLSTDEDGNLVVSRKISADGRSISKINGITVSVTTLKNISHILVNIHGQHDGAKILNPANHIDFLDSYCQNEELLFRYREKYNFVKELRNKIVSLTELNEKKQELEENLKSRITEIEQAEIVVGELERLKQKSKDAEKSSIIQNALHTCDEILSGEESGIIDSLSVINSQLETLTKIYPKSTELIESLTRAKSELDDISSEIAKKLMDYDDFDYSPDLLEKRIYSIESLVKKYGSEQNVLDSLAEFKIELESLEDNEAILAELSSEYSVAVSQLESLALEISNDRIEKSKTLSKQICNQLRELDMPGTKFEVSVLRNKNAKGGNKYTLSGFDCVEFFISPNAGQDSKPLSKIASGGELSRIMLCLKTILNSNKDECNTIIYDEVDSGVSGSTAQKIGIKLKKSATDSQVFSITHLAQIAALADNHYKVEKNTENSKTLSSIKLLTHNERVMEIARIMGGVEITDQIIRSAKELINNSKMC